MFDPFKKLKLAGAFLGVADDAASPTAENLDIAELFGRLSLKDLRGMTLPAEAILDQPGVRPLYETRYMPAPEPLDRLAEMGEGTLGAEYVRYLRQYKIPQPQVPRRLDLADPAVYLAQRVRMTHAMLHVITEYDASPLGELALQAYYIGQLGNLISGVIIASAIFQITRDTPDLLGPALEVTSEAFQRGKQARSFLGVAWEELWSAQVPQLRELIDLVPRTSPIAMLRLEAPKSTTPDRNDRSDRNDRERDRDNRSGSFNVSAFSDKEDGLVALGRSRSPSTPHSQAQSQPPPRERGVFSGFNSTPVPDMPRSEPSRAEPARREPAAPETRSRASSTSAASSSLLASFMALAEQAQQPQPPEAKRPEPKPEPKAPAPPKTIPPAPRPEAQARPPVKQPPPPPAPAKPAPPAPLPEPTYKVEEPANITPALSPDDPDYF